MDGGGEVIFRTTDDYWERLGASEPYWGVLTHDMYRASNMTAESRRLFFESGERHVADVFGTVRRHVKPDFQPKTALDFGCGVGRVVVALAPRVAQVVGVDVAPSMLREAKSNCEARGIDNVELVLGGAGADALPGHSRFDFIHSVLVLQHVPEDRGVRIFKRLLAQLEDDGVAAVHFLCWIKPRWPALSALRSQLPFGDRLWNAMRRPARMQMNSYNLNELLLIIRATQARSFHVDIVQDQDTVGVVLYVRKPSIRRAG